MSAAGLIAGYAQAASPREKTQCLGDIAGLDAEQAKAILGPLDEGDLLLAVDDDLICVYHDNSGGTTYYAAPQGRSGSSRSGGGNWLNELRWLGPAEGEPFGFSNQRYSVFAGEKRDEEAYLVCFIVYENGKFAGLNAGPLNQAHYDSLRQLGLWPSDWKWEP